MAEEAQKRNTDCVYYLASPLTCKKGNACEFRHSESARMNPRDCWYWFAGNCLMTNCSFRHPPLDGRPNNLSSITPVSSASTAPVTVLAKPRGPCYFFSSGYCAKGENCTFLHGSPVVETFHQNPQTASTNRGSEIHEKLSTLHSKGNGSAVRSCSLASVKGVSQNPRNVFIRAQNSAVVSTAITPLSGDKKEQDDHLLSRNTIHVAMENQQQESELKNESHLLVGTSLQKNFLRKEEHSDENGLPKEGSPMNPDENNGSVYKRDWEYYKEDEECHVQRLYELGHLEMPEEFHEADWDSSMFGSDSSSWRGRIRTSRDLRDHLMQRRLQRKECTSVKGENSEEVNHLNLNENQYDYVQTETGGENHRTSYQHSRGKQHRKVKRLRRDFGLDYEGDTMQFGNLHRRYGHVKSKSKVGQIRCDSSEVGKKSLVSTFVGPKSLAEIRAERDKDSDSGLKNEEYRDRREDTYFVKGKICSVINK